MLSLRWGFHCVAVDIANDIVVMAVMTRVCVVMVVSVLVVLPTCLVAGVIVATRRQG